MTSGKHVGLGPRIWTPAAHMLTSSHKTPQGFVASYESGMPIVIMEGSR